MKLLAPSSHFFHQSVTRSLQQVEKILDIHRNPRFAEHVDHEYQDKYHLVELMTNTAIAAILNALEQMGLQDLDPLFAVLQQGKSVTLRMEAERTCEFLEEKIVEIEDTGPTVEVTKETATARSREKTTYKHKVITTVHEYHWKVAVSFKLFLYGSNDPENKIVVLDDQNLTRNLITTGCKGPPIPARLVAAPMEVNLTWLLQQLSPQKECCFSIDRSADSCRTPRRNEQIDQALDFLKKLQFWVTECRNFLTETGRQFGHSHNKASAGENDEWGSFGRIQINNVFEPVLPLMEEGKKQGEGPADDDMEIAPTSLALVSAPPASSPVLPIGDISLFLYEQKKTLKNEVEALKNSFPQTAAIAEKLLVWLHISSLVEQWYSVIGYVETMLRDQLIAAIGKEVSSEDLDGYVRFQNKRLLGDRCKPFCYDIRRPEHYPDGILTIESKVKDEVLPIETISRSISGDAPTFIPINAATTIEFAGDRFLHIWMQHRFASVGGIHNYSVNARARQFSSFLLMVGTVSGPDQFTPKDAIILQNKDQVIIPLLLEDLPTAKDFRDAIASLSPEQQSFARSFRNMQLESSVFGLCVVQLKPQLEALLGLPPDALTKEIQLTQDLLSLFIDYQVPSDLLTFDGSLSAAVRDKVGAVKGHVKAVMDVIEAAKKKELEDEQQKAQMNKAQQGFKVEFDSMDAQRSSFVPAMGSQSFSFGQQMPAMGKQMHMCTPYAAPAPMMMAAPAMSMSVGAPAMPMAAPAMSMAAPAMSMAVPATSMAGGTVSGIDAGGARAVLDQDAPMEGNDNTQGGKTDETLSGKDIDDWDMVGLDVTKIPKKLDALFEKEDTDNALRTTIIKAGPNWKRHRQENLLTKPKESHLSEHDKKTEKNKAFDLLDALSRSGSLPIASGELHVVLGVAHCFEDSVMDTVILKNVNPIEKIRNSTLMIASSVHGSPSPQIENV